MLKVFILTLLFVAGHARFNVTVNGTVCVLLEVEGTLNLEAFENNTLRANKSLNFADAGVLNTSSCTEIQLDLGSDAQVWFQFRNSSETQWLVTPIVAFDAAKTLGLNETESLTGQASPLTAFGKNESFTCKASVSHAFNISTTKNYSYTAVANTVNFKVQATGIVNETFSSGEECDEDKPTSTPTSSTTSTSHGTTTTEIPEPTFSCVDNGTTRFQLKANITLAITYKKLDNTNGTAYIEVPRNAIAQTNCSEANEESLKILLLGDWSLEYVFQRTSNGSKEYFVSNITLIYNTAKLLNASGENLTASYYDGSKEYLKASTDGYYACNSNSSVILSSEVRLFTAELKYKAFNDKAVFNMDGNVSECSADEETSSIVPIAVGAALAGLVVIVLIAYLIGRRRSRKAGYESV